MSTSNNTSKPKPKMEPSTAPAAPTIQPAASVSAVLAAASSEPGPSTAPAPAAAATRSETTAAPMPRKDGKPPRLNPHDPSLEPMSEVMLRRVTRIKEGDNVLLKLPSDSVKAVVAAKDGLVQLGKFGSFPASLLLGLHYDITYEVYTDPNAIPPAGALAKHGARAETAAQTSGRIATDRGSSTSGAFGQAKGKKSGKGKGNEAKPPGEVKSNPGWRNLLRPLKRSDVVDAVVDDIVETNEFIDDTDTIQQELLTQDEIAEMRAQGISAEDMIKAQIARHERFGLKTDFSKEKWRKRKEKKYLQTIHPISPSAHNMANHYFTRSPANILHLREDTLSQLYTLSNVRPGGRYLVVDDTGGLVTAGLMERMGCEGRIMSFVESDSPPAWGVLNVMNFSQRELGCVNWLNWMEAREEYERPPLPEEVDMPSVSEAKTIARQRKHMYQTKELNNTRRELHSGNWDGLILATDLNPIVILERLYPYLAGSSTITVFSPHLQVLAETLQFCRFDPGYLNANLTESWSRTYQVLPGRTHPTMSTSATGGYLLHATKVFVGSYEPDSHVFRNKRRQDQDAAKRKKAKVEQAGKATAGAAAEGTAGTGEKNGEEDEEMEEVGTDGGTEI